MPIALTHDMTRVEAEQLMRQTQFLMSTGGLVTAEEMTGSAGQKIEKAIKEMIDEMERDGEITD